MKLSVSLPDADVEFVDRYAREQSAGSRSAVLHKAIRLLKAHELRDDYAAAWDEWSITDDSPLWDSAVADVGRG